MKALVVDNDRMYRDTVQHLLKEKGFEVEVCADGIRAIEIGKKWHPDLLVIAEHLPKFTGIEVIDLFRKSQPKLPFLLMMLSEESQGGRFSVPTVKKPFEVKAFEEQLESIIPGLAVSSYDTASIRKLLKNPFLQPLPKEATLKLAERVGIVEESSGYALRTEDRQLFLLIPFTANLDDLAEVSDRALQLQLRLIEARKNELCQLWPLNRKAA